MKTQRIEFPGSQGTPLAGRLEQPETAPRGWALFAHCLTCSKDSKAPVHISRALVEAGFGVLRFGFTGLGGSGGDFASTDFFSNVDDLVAAADWLREEQTAPALLIGHSLGGAAILAATHRIDDAVAVATIGAPFDPGHVTRQFGEHIDRIETEGEAEVTLGGRAFTIKRALLDDLNCQRQAERIRKLRRPLMVLHAPGDTVVAIDNASAIFQTALHPKSFVSLDDADHLLARQSDAGFVADVIAAWAGRYLKDGQQVARASTVTDSDTLAKDDAVHVSECSMGAFTVAISAGRHGWLGDEPSAAGGNDLGSNPYQLLTAALGPCACTPTTSSGRSETSAVWASVEKPLEFGSCKLLSDFATGSEEEVQYEHNSEVEICRSGKDYRAFSRPADPAGALGFAYRIGLCVSLSRPVEIFEALRIRRSNGAAGLRRVAGCVRGSWGRIAYPFRRATGWSLGQSGHTAGGLGVHSRSDRLHCHRPLAAMELHAFGISPHGRNGVPGYARAC